VQLTAELSLYPLREEYVAVIDAFIATLHEHGELTVVTNAMSTQISGEWDAVFDLINRELKISAERHGRQVLVCKLIPGELDLQS
jgi:uncharacterized protein YqgV (UPF0045/DUF77 family)